MKKSTVIALACAAVVVVGVGVASFFVNAPSSSPPASSPTSVTQAADADVTLILHAVNAERVTYTCMKAGEVDVCQTSVSMATVWSQKVVVPAGTTVRVQAQGSTLPPWCSITDKSDRMVLNKNHETGDCETVAGQ